MSLSQLLFNNSLRDWLIALGLGAGVYVALVVVKRALVARFSIVAARTDTDIDDALVDLLRRTRWFFFAAIGTILATQHLTLPDRARHFWEGTLLPVLLLLQVGLWIVGLVGFLTDRALKRRSDGRDGVGVAAIKALGVAAKVVAWAVLLVVAVEWAFHQNVTVLVTSLGVGGIAIALAVQQVLGDILAAVSIVFDQPFDVNDDITVEGVTGTVERVGLKTTRLRSATGEQIIFSNANLLKSRIHNFSRMTERRASFTIDLHPATPVIVAGKVPAIIEETVRAQPLARFVRCHLTLITDSALRYECVYFVQQRQLIASLDVQQAVALELLRRFSAERIEFARPVVAALVKS